MRSFSVAKCPFIWKTAVLAIYDYTYLRDQLEGSLRRLGTDYLDLYLLHHVDEQTPAEEIGEAMQRLVDAGSVRYWGVSNHCAAQVRTLLETGSVAAVEEYYNIAGVHLDAEETRARAVLKRK